MDAITRTISDHGEVLDSASPQLAVIRREIHSSQDKLLTRLQHFVNDPLTATMLQEALITQRDGRYVLPLRSEFKGRIKSIVHDQSSSGATLFVEPLPVVELNNQLREMQLAERDEIRRILAEISFQVGEHSEEIFATVDLLAEMDLTLAKARQAEELRAVEPKLHPMRARGGKAAVVEVAHPGCVIRLFDARHPLLDPAKVVPIDVELDPQTYCLVITGPNTGGKTVTLKTIGLLTVMALSGLFIPASAGSELSAFDNIYADIGDEQSIEQSLSTFSGHITNIIRILERSDRRSLVILDELGAGTDPQEGAALARSILSHLLQRGITTLVTTHHPELKAFAHSVAGAINASVEFNLETLRPTYRLMIGIPGRSNALAIAQRLGLPEAIIQDARAEINPEDLKADDLLNEIYRQRDQSRQARQAAEKAQRDAETLRLELALRLEQIEDERVKVLDEARQQADGELSAVRGEVQAVRRQLTRTKQPVEPVQEAQEKIEELQEKLEKPVKRRRPKLGAAMEKLEEQRRRALQVGDKIRLRSLGAQGVIIAINDEDVEVQIGMLRMRAAIDDIERPTTITVPPPLMRVRAGEKIPERPQGILPASPGIELDLRGKRVDEAVEELERYLDAAFVAGLPFVRIIHGKGTGKLRESVRQALREHPHIRSFDAGSDKEGGEGVTVVKMA